MVADVLKEAINLIKDGKKIKAREILEPFIVANPQNIQAWIWEIETRENDTEKIKLMEACLLHNPDSTMIKKALAALKTRQEFLVTKNEKVSPFITTEVAPDKVFDSEEYQKTAEVSSKEKPCPYCGELVKSGADFCDACGRELTGEEVNIEKKIENVKPRKKWYRKTWVKILFFIFLMPVWCVIELSDPETLKGIKILAGILLVFFINILCMILYWFFTTNSSKANLLNWYRYLTDQTHEILPDGLVRVDGAIQNLNTLPFSLVELQAKVYDKNGNLLGNNTRYLDSTLILPGSPARFQLDVTSLISSVNGGDQVLHYDDFSNNSSGWSDSISDEGETTYFEDQYRIAVNKANYDLWSTPGLLYSDAKIEVDAAKLAGSESNRFGIICRYTNMDNYYFAVISSDGYYGIGKVVEGSQTFMQENGMQVTDTVNAGSMPNHIRFDCVGTRLSLYVNGDYVDAVDDSDLSSGDVGLLAGTFENIGTKISFDNFIVLNP